jgi:hypothetical protein
VEACGPPLENGAASVQFDFRLALVDCQGGFRHARLEQGGELFSREWMAEEITLTFRAELGLQIGFLLVGLNAFGDHDVFKTFSHGDDRADHNNFRVRSGQIANKGLVNFQHVDAKPAQIAEAGITGPEIVHRESYTNALQFVEHGKS